jgi:hypothetical protein
MITSESLALKGSPFPRKGEQAFLTVLVICIGPRCSVSSFSSGASSKGYTWGIVRELHTRDWAFRYGIVAEPKIANSSQFDRRLFRDHEQV